MTLTTDTKMGNSGFETGARIRIADGAQDAGRCGSVVGDEVFAGQWWCPVLWDDAEDPDFHKSGCMEPLGEMTPEDWRELLHTLTREMRAVTPDNPVGMRQDRLMAIVGKIGSGKTGELSTDEMDEIRRSLRRDAEGCIDGGVRLRTILGKMDGGRRPVLQAVGREELLARCYNMAPTAVAEMCDEELDRSGALLGRVRELAAEMARVEAT